MKFIITISILISALALSSQVAPDYGLAFPQNEVAEIHITIDPDSLIEMIDSLENVHEYPAKFVFMSNALNDTLDTIGIRLRGQSSLGASKKSFKLEFDAFDGNADWQGLEKMNLLAQHNDVSMLRSKICYDAFRQFGIPCARTSYVRLYINEEYRGLYLNVESLDNKMTKLHFDGEGDGNLYKCTYPATLQYISDNPSDYKFALWDVRQYELQNNSYFDNYSDLAHFIDVLVNTPLNDLSCELPQVFNVEDYLLIAAMDILLGNWDGHIYNKNNFYLYNDQFTNRMRYIPYDLDNTFGMDWLNIDWAERNIYTWSPTFEDRPLYQRLLAVPEFRDRFSYNIERICNEFFNTENIAVIAENWQNLIASSIENDLYFTLDNGFTYSDFLDAINTAWGEHLEYGILEYVESRRSNALSQLESYDAQEAQVHWQAVRYSSTSLIVDADIEGPDADECSILISNNGIDYTSIPYQDIDGIEQTANDGIYTYVDALPNNDIDRTYYAVQLPNGDTWPCEAQFIWNTPLNSGLYINEVLISNTSTNADEQGQYEDWVELYNSTNQTINLAGKYLTDNISNENRFPLPSINIPANSFQIIWLDDDLAQGTLHANFKLSAGESIYLMDEQDGELRVADYAGPFDLTTDISLERTIDGGPIWALTSDPTPGLSNTYIDISEFQNTKFYIYPNPTSEIIYFSKAQEKINLFDATGRLLRSYGKTTQLIVSDLPSGVYHLEATDGRIPFVVSKD
jgi:CotH kinase protein/Lamin Tail Domain/Secretion system C-terminal sorting domain